MLTSAPDKINSGTGGLNQGNGFRRQHRLLKHDVVTLLHSGARLNCGELGLKLSQNSLRQGRIAIAVPKRIVKFSVDRNQVKRLIREQFRQHPARTLPVDLLVTFQRRLPAKQGRIRATKILRKQLRHTLAQLFGDVRRRFGVIE